MPVEVSPAFEYRSTESFGTGTLLDRQVFRTLFHDNDDDKGSVIPPMSVLRMRTEREDVLFAASGSNPKPRGTKP